MWSGGGSSALLAPDKRSMNAGGISAMDDEPIRIPVTDIFDLHSVPDRDVRGVVEAYLEEACELRFRYVRIIHGRGIGVRREMVRGLLSRCEFVESFSDAPGEAGGWGATLVTLKAADG
jgi:dsDNA-specific endonuclease/ATPase MutS2